jgi:hypothetical protein
MNLRKAPTGKNNNNPNWTKFNPFTNDFIDKE